MTNTSFTDEGLFASPAINIRLNIIYDALLAQGYVAFDTKFAITGTVAKIIQGAALEPIKVVPLITDQDAIIGFCQTELSKLTGATGAVVLADRVQLIYPEIYVEIWHAEVLGTLNTVTNLIVQDVADIPEEIL